MLRDVDTSTLSQDGNRPFGVPFRYVVWSSVFVRTVLYLSSQPYRPFLRTVMPLISFWLLGFVLGLQGVDFGTSLRILIFWALMAFVALTLRPQVNRRLLCYTSAAVLELSCFIGIALPEAGQQL